MANISSPYFTLSQTHQKAWLSKKRQKYRREFKVQKSHALFEFLLARAQQYLNKKTAQRSNQDG